MIPAPQKIQHGAPRHLRVWLNNLRDYVLQSTPLPGPGCDTFTGANGTLIVPQVSAPAAPSASSGSAPHPFQLIPFPDGDTIKLRVKYGTLAGSAPTGFTEGDDPPFLLTVTGTGVVYGLVTVNESATVTSRTIGFAASLPADTDPDSESAGLGHIELGSYSVDSESGAITVAQAVSGSQAYQYCDGHLWGLI